MEGSTEGNGTQQVAEQPTGRQRWVERFAKSHPDRSFDGENGDSDLFGLAADEMDRVERENGEYRTFNDKMNEMFNRDGRYAHYWDEVGSGGDPIEKWVEIFGDDLLEAMKSEEGMARFSAARQKWLDGKAEEDRKAEEARKAEEESERQKEANMAKSIEACMAFAQSHGLDEQAAVDLLVKVHDFCERGIDLDYDEEMFRMAYNAGNHDRDVEVARREGEVTGRNSKIRRELRESEGSKGAIPSLGGSATREAEYDGPRRPATIPGLGIAPAKRK